MGKYETYLKCKDSGVERLGKVPKHWKIKRLRFSLTINPSKSEIKLQEGELVSFIPMEAVGEYGGLSLDTQKTLDEIGTGYTYFAENDVVIAKITPCFENGKGAIAKDLTNQIAFGTTELHVLRANAELSKAFLFYLTISQSFRKLGEAEMFGAGGQKRVPENFIKDFWVALPPLPEQNSIARFLDYKTAQIDALIAKKEALLEKLAEKRTALISQAVTKGLDRSVPMKDSAIEWLGEIPAHWIVSRLKHTTELIVDGTHLTPTYINEGIPFLRVTDIVQAGMQEINLDNVKFISEEEHDFLSRRCKTRKGDLLYSKNGTIGVPKIIAWDFEFSIFVSLCLIKINKRKIMSKFLYYSLLGKLTQIQITIGAKSNTVTNLHLDKIKEFWVCLPSLSEQDLIVRFLDYKTAQVDLLISKNEVLLEKLKEYRTALITNAVTGAIDVRDVKIPAEFLK